MRNADRRERGLPPPRDGGFTLLEILITGIVFGAIALGVGLAILASWGAAGRLSNEHLVFAQAQTFADTLAAIRFGRADDSAVDAADVAEVLDSDTFPGDVSLHQFAKACPLVFTLDGFPTSGEWTIDVSDDLNDDGDSDDSLEGRDDLLRISIRFDGTPVLETFRCMPTVVEEPGEANPLYEGNPPSNLLPLIVDDLLALGRTAYHDGFRAAETGLWPEARGPEDPGEPEDEP